MIAIVAFGTGLAVALMWIGANRKTIREGGGRGTGDNHFYEMEGASRLSIFITPNAKVKGYQTLKQFLESEGCEVIYPADSEERPGPRYQVVQVTYSGKVIPSSVLKRAHRWAHQRNFLHSFFKPLFQRPGPGV